MKYISTTEARKHLGRLIEDLDDTSEVVGLGRRDKIEAILIKYPEHLNPMLDEITNFNANSTSFDFLADEPDLYSLADLKRRYV